MNKTLISTMMICGAGFAFSDDLVVEVIGENNETMSLTLYEAETNVIQSHDFMKEIADFKLENGFCGQFQEVKIDDPNFSVNMTITLTGNLSLVLPDDELGETDVKSLGAVLVDDISFSLEDINEICIPDSDDGDSGDGDNLVGSAT